jgi:hypothetical protein
MFVSDFSDKVNQLPQSGKASLCGNLPLVYLSLSY